jgi:dihydroxyacetone kinase-like protein
MDRIESTATRRRAGTDSASRAALTAPDVVRFVECARLSLDRHLALLDRLDAALGDGDHGGNMALGFRAASAVARAGLIEWPDDVGELLRRVGHTLVGSVGGASGPLYGTVFIEAGFALAGQAAVGPGDLAGALEAGQAALARRGRCAIGDKTILDALAPGAAALRAAADAGQPLGACLGTAALAAGRGAKATVPLVARRGLALRLGERSRGHRDPGAASCFLLLAAMARAAGDDGPP